MKNIKIIPFLISIFVFSSCVNHFEKGKEFYNKGDYSNALNHFEVIKKDNENYHKANQLIIKCDSVLKFQLHQKFINDSIAEVIENVRLDSIRKIEAKIAEENEIIRLKKELSGIKTFNGGEYRGEISTLTLEIALFSTWGKIAEKAKESKNKEIVELGKNIVYHLTKLQVKEFPKIRAEYANILKNKLWVQDIEVITFGGGKTTLQFTGGTFAANKNIQEYQSTLQETFTDFRFKRINYKWYKYDDKYTYYELSPYKDNEIRVY